MEDRKAKSRDNTITYEEWMTAITEADSTNGVKSKYVGVSWDKEQKKWRAEGFRDGKQQKLGRFKDEKDAAIAYLQWRLENIPLPQCSTGSRYGRPFQNVSSKYKGVYWFKARMLWRARCYKNKQCYFLGDFKSEKEAALAYDKEAMRLFGDQSLTNQMAFPEDFK